MRARLMIGAAAVAIIAGCGGDPKLNHFSSRSPDEFAILPTMPLQMPETLNELPAPTPGGANRTDPHPEADAVAALGGNPAALSVQGVGAGDGALLGHAGRMGTDPAIRQELAEKDAEYRSRHRPRLLERLAGTNVYQRAYKDQAINRHTEQDRWRNAGARTPSAPPEGYSATGQPVGRRTPDIPKMQGD